MIELVIAWTIGFVIGTMTSFKDQDVIDETMERNEKYRKYEKEIKYYKDLCKWHVDQKKQLTERINEKL